MKALWHGAPYHITDDDGEGVTLECLDEDAASFYVEFSSPTLVIEPTDTEWASAKEGILPNNYTDPENLYHTIAHILIDVMHKLRKEQV